MLCHLSSVLAPPLAKVLVLSERHQTALRWPSQPPSCRKTCATIRAQMCQGSCGEVWSQHPHSTKGTCLVPPQLAKTRDGWSSVEVYLLNPEIVGVDGEW